MAEECRAREHSSEALIEMGEEGHVRHGIRRKIQKMGAVGVHDVVEEVRKRRAEPAREVVDEEGVPVWDGLAKSAGPMCVARCPVVALPHRGKK